MSPHEYILAMYESSVDPSEQGRKKWDTRVHVDYIAYSVRRVRHLVKLHEKHNKRRSTSSPGSRSTVPPWVRKKQNS